MPTRRPAPVLLAAIAVVVLAAIALVAFHPWSKNGSPGPAQAGGAPTASTYDALTTAPVAIDPCVLFDRAAAEAALGVTLGTPYATSNDRGPACAAGVPAETSGFVTMTVDGETVGPAVFKQKEGIAGGAPPAPGPWVSARAFGCTPIAHPTSCLTVVEAGQLKLEFSHSASGQKGITGPSDMTRWASVVVTKHLTNADQPPADDPTPTPAPQCTYADVSFCPGGINFGRTP